MLTRMSRPNRLRLWVVTLSVGLILTSTPARGWAQDQQSTIALLQAAIRQLQADHWDLASAMLREAQKRLEDEGQSGGALHVETLHKLGFALLCAGEYAKSEPVFRQCSRLAGLKFDQNHTAVVRNQGNLGVILTLLGRHDEAKKILEECVQREQACGRQATEQFGQLLRELGHVEIAMGDFKNAHMHYSESKKVVCNATGQSEEQYLRWLIDFGNLSYLQGNLDEAERLLSQGLEKMRERQNLWMLADCAYYAGLVSQSRGKHAIAEGQFEEALRLMRHKPGERHPSYANVLIALTATLCDRGRSAEAEAYARYAYQIMEEKCGTDSEPTRRAVKAYCKALRQSGKGESADLLLKTYRLDMGQ